MSPPSSLPIIIAILADAATGYFVAIRQMIFVLPAVAILAAAGIEGIIANRRLVTAWSLGIAVVATQVVASEQWFERPREDWKVIAQTLSKARSRYDCIVFVPKEIALYFGIFNSALPALSCSPSQLAGASAAAVAALSAAAPAQRSEALSLPNLSEMKHRSILVAGDPSITIFSRN